MDVLWRRGLGPKSSGPADGPADGKKGTINDRSAVRAQARVTDRRILRLIQKWLKAGVSEDCQWSETKLGTPQGAVVTPLTQKVISAFSPARRDFIALRRVRSGYWNAMANRDGVFSNQDVFHDQPERFSALSAILLAYQQPHAGRERNAVIFPPTAERLLDH